MKAYVERARDCYGEGKVKEYPDLTSCIEEELKAGDFHGWKPSVIVSKGDVITKDKCGEDCDWEITIYDDWIE